MILIEDSSEMEKQSGVLGGATLVMFYGKFDNVIVM